MEIEGFFDGVADGNLIGWEWDEFDSGASVSVEIYHENALLSARPSNEFRHDLFDAGKGDGRHAFSYALPEPLKQKKASDFRVKVAGTEVELFEAPIRFRLPMSEIQRPPEPLLVLTGHADPALFFPLAEEIATVARKYGRIRPSGRVLDIGCGVGWLAIPLTKYLSSRGRYDGIDIMPDAIEWCRHNISPAYPNFKFQHADIHSRYYNPNATVRPTEYVFPYETDQFDLVFLSSVFTHLLPADLEHYLSEIARMLCKGGRCLISYFLLDDTGALKYAENKPTDIDFKFKGGVYRTANREIPEAAVAYEEGYIRKLYAENGLQIIEPIHTGAQDLIVATK